MLNRAVGAICFMRFGFCHVFRLAQLVDSGLQSAFVLSGFSDPFCLKIVSCNLFFVVFDVAQKLVAGKFLRSCVVNSCSL